MFDGMSRIYDRARPKLSADLADMIARYLGRKPQRVVDIGCGTGQSIEAWIGKSEEIYALEPNEEFRQVAQKKFATHPEVTISSQAGEHTGLSDSCADVITCVQVFHWLNDKYALPEFARILKKGGILAACDFGFPPLSMWKSDRAYEELILMQKEMDKKYPTLNSDVFEGDKTQNFTKFKNSGLFLYCRNASFTCSEMFDAERYIDLAFSQSTLNRIVKSNIPEAMPIIENFKKDVRSAFGTDRTEIQFCVQLTIGIRE